MSQLPDFATRLDPSDPLQIALRAARVGADVLMPYFHGGVVTEVKEGEASCNLVSEADRRSEQAIAREIRAAAPGDSLLGEEELRADAASERLWIIDPLDGTNNFAHALPHFAVSIAFYRSGQPECGVVFNPVRDDLYLAARGRGAWHNGRPMAVATATRLDEVLIGCGFYYDRGAMMRCTLAAIESLFGENIHGMRRFGTAALDLCQVAAGQFGAYFEYQLSPWDFAAGRLIVEEAGGRVTDARGGPLPLATTGVIAAAPGVQQAFTGVVARHHPQ